jgi:hypothetical protein
MADSRSDWPRGLPPIDETPVFVAPDPTRLLLAGRRTRRMHAAMAGATAVALITVSTVAGLSASANRADRVTVVTPPVERTPRPPDKGPTIPSAPVGKHASPSLVFVPDAGTDAVDDGSVDAAAPAQLPSAASSAKPPPSVVTATGFRRSTVTDPAASSCAYQPSSAPSGWCLDYSGPSASRAGMPVFLSVDICRIRGLGTGTLHFGNAQEADVRVYGSEEKHWQWSHGRQFAATPHTVRVTAGTCLRWTTRWTTRDDNGQLLPRGSYSISVSVQSPDVDLPNSTTGTATSFELT